MSLTPYEQFLGHDWCRYSGIASKATCIGTACIGVASILFGYSFWLGFLSLYIGSVMAIWEFPFIYFFIPKFDQFQTYLMEKLYFKTDEVKAICCILLSVMTYISPSLVILSGIMLDVTALLYIFAGINRRQDAKDGVINDVEQQKPYEQKVPTTAAAFTASTVTQGLLGKNGRFGTF